MAPAGSMRGSTSLVRMVVVLVMSINVLEADAQSGCTSVLISLSPCLSYVGGSATTPSSSCCSQLGNVVQSQPRCLCMLLNGGAASLGVTMNETLALALPAACKVVTPPVTRCNAAGDNYGPAMPPFFSPAASPTASSSESSTSQGSRANSMKKYLHFMTALITLLAVTMGSYA